jgi:hypothetical protein
MILPRPARPLSDAVGPWCVAAVEYRVRAVNERAVGGRGPLPRRYHRLAPLVPLADSITPTPGNHNADTPWNP